MKKLSSAGFSLVELMVVVAIIGILATIAVPQVSKFMAKAKQSEAKSNLSAAYSANKAFFAEYNGYHTRFPVIGFSPEGALKYNIGFNNDRAKLGPLNYASSLGAGAVPGAAGDISAAGYCTTARGCSLATEATAGGAVTGITTATSDTAFTVGASSLLRSGGTVTDQWRIDQTRTITWVSNGID